MPLPLRISRSRRTPAACAALVAFALVLPWIAPSSASAASAPARPGARRWVARSTVGDYATSLGVSPDGTTVFVTGSGTSNIDIVTEAYRAGTGVLLWQAEWDGEAHKTDESYSIAVSPDGTKVFVTGHTTVYATTSDAVTLAYDARSGTLLWASQYDGGKDDSGQAVAVSPDGTRVFVTGSSVGPGTDGDVLTLGYDAATGGQLWVARYNGPVDWTDDGSDIAVAPGGDRVYVAGFSAGNGYVDDAVTLSYDAATGAQVWVARYDGPAHASDLAEAVAVSPDGSLVFMGGQTGDDGLPDYVTVGYDAATGSALWENLFDGPGHYADVVFDVKPSPDGAVVYVTGEGSIDDDVFTFAYDAVTGAQVWMARFSAPWPSVDAGCCLAVSADGTTLYVGGTTYSDYLALSYVAASGTLRWSGRYDGPANGNGFDLAEGAAMSPTGRLFYVTGQSQGLSGQDFATVAFTA